jgi:hypothetical protein
VNGADALVDRYVALWNTDDPVVRRRELEELLTPDAVYTDPVVSLRGHGAIEALIGTARVEVAGGRMLRLRRPDAHHDVVRFNAEVVLPDRAAALLVMSTTGVLTPDGRFRAAYVFFDRMTEAWRRIVRL